jgi:hypothetical protein
LPYLKRKRRHPEKTRECRLIYLFDSNKKPKARDSKEKSGNDSQNGNCLCGAGASPANAGSTVEERRFSAAQIAQDPAAFSPGGRTSSS